VGWLFLVGMDGWSLSGLYIAYCSVITGILHSKHFPSLFFSVPCAVSSTSLFHDAQIPIRPTFTPYVITTRHPIPNRANQWSIQARPSSDNDRETDNPPPPHPPPRQFDCALPSQHTTPTPPGESNHHQLITLDRPTDRPIDSRTPTERDTARAIDCAGCGSELRSGRRLRTED
jgi:hypothetical protein